MGLASKWRIDRTRKLPFAVSGIIPDSGKDSPKMLTQFGKVFLGNRIYATSKYQTIDYVLIKR